MFQYGFHREWAVICRLDKQHFCWAIHSRRNCFCFTPQNNPTVTRFVNGRRGNMCAPSELFHADSKFSELIAKRRFGACLCRRASNPFLNQVVIKQVQMLWTNVDQLQMPDTCVDPHKKPSVPFISRSLEPCFTAHFHKVFCILSEGNLVIRLIAQAKFFLKLQCLFRRKLVRPAFACSLRRLKSLIVPLLLPIPRMSHRHCNLIGNTILPDHLFDICHLRSLHKNARRICGGHCK